MIILPSKVIILPSKMIRVSNYILMMMEFSNPLTHPEKMAVGKNARLAGGRYFRITAPGDRKGEGDLCASSLVQGVDFYEL